MTRPSKREHILDAALTVVEADGVAALTLDAVAVAAGITKGGLLYHFASKDALLVALHERLARVWSEEISACAGGVQPEELSPRDRMIAYTRASAHSATGTELRLMLEAGSTPELSAPWADVMRRWLPDPAAADADDPEQVALLLAQFTADGLWMAGAILTDPIPVKRREQLAEYAIQALRAETVTRKKAR